MIMERNWSLISDFIADKKNILITTHVNPDGDAIGSQVAVAEYLSQKGKNVHMVNCSPMPKFFHFLDPENMIKVFEDFPNGLFESLDGVIVVDISDWGRLKGIGEAIQKNNIPIACIDHHIPSDDMGEIVVSDQTASSTGELLYDFFEQDNCIWTQRMVDGLYTCILTDTGSFRFSNTTPLTHRISADLIDKGADFRKIYEAIYESQSKNRAVLLGKMLAELQFECDDRLAWYVLTRKILTETGAQDWEIEGFSELPRTIENVEISIMFTETKDGKTKISFRSKGRIPINGLANEFGGGGHKFAAGATLQLNLEEAKKQIIKKAKILVENFSD